MKDIVTDGFRLPSRAGMFGKGIYFADTPLKSWQYSVNKKSRYLLIAEVALGRPMKQSTARNINPQTDFRPRAFAWLFGARRSHSVVALTHEQGGSVRVPEFVVYNPDQAVV